MCGIFALFNILIDNKTSNYKTLIENAFNKGAARGPESSTLFPVNQPGTFLRTCLQTYIGFHRLAINGLDTISNQPMVIDEIYLICNGEIYNYKQLFKMMKITPKSNSDCEIIIHLYKQYGIEHTLQMLDGVFSFVLYDIRLPKYKVYIARDPYGVRSLFKITSKSAIDNPTLFGFASEIKSLVDFYTTNNTANNTIDNNLTNMRIDQFPPGTYSMLEQTSAETFESVICEKSYCLPGVSSFSSFSDLTPNSNHSFSQAIVSTLYSAVQKRVTTTDRPIACLLSGGFDSSIITAIVNHYHAGQLETYSIGMKGSDDLKYAKQVAKHIGSKHTEVIVTENEMFNAIPEVIHAIESYDTTTVRASVGNYLISKYISKNSTAKVIFNGDGADEIMGGYLYFGHASDAIEYDKECRRLLHDIYMFDVLRSDKSISSNGLEARTPFLDKQFVQTYLNIPIDVRYNTHVTNCEKYLIRNAFKKMGLLPADILWRRKEAFSDGVSGDKQSWYQIIDKKITEQFGNKYTTSDNSIKHIYPHNTPTTQEQLYYRELFEKYYPNMSHTIPYFWMPKYVNATDSSARSLGIYQNI
jgi:asparagine synthase (glutamine-hydrolysing)